MLDRLEDALLDRLDALRAQVPRIELRSYGGELSDPDLLTEVLRAGTAVLITVPKARFTRKGATRWQLDASIRLVIAARQSRSEAATRHGTAAGGTGTYALWQACLNLLANYVPLEESTALSPTDFASLVRGKDQADYLSVVGQSFDVTASWSAPRDHADALAGVDLTYYLQPDDGVADATDRVELTLMESA
jgi:phage gp37-like protein